MVRRFLKAIAIASGCLTAGLHFALAQTVPQSAAPRAVVIGSTQEIYARSLDQVHEVNIFTPRNYRETEDGFPVLYVIDGGLDQDFIHIAGLADLSAVNGNYENLIIVGVKTNNRFYELTGEASDPRYVRPAGQTGGSTKFRAFLTDDVIPYIEENFRTNGRRAVIGESLAGLFIVETFLTTPDAFTDYIAVSPSLWYDDRRLAKNAAQTLRTHPAKERRLYLTMADEGGTMQKGLDELLAAIKTEKPKGLKWTYVDRRKTDHHWTIYHGAALDALRWTFGLPDPVFDGETPWYLVEGKNPPGWGDDETGEQTD